MFKDLDSDIRTSYTSYTWCSCDCPGSLKLSQQPGVPPIEGGTLCHLNR